jgi:hypothetical protein
MDRVPMASGGSFRLSTSQLLTGATHSASPEARPRECRPRGLCHFSAHQAPAQSFPPMSKDPTLKPTESAYW